MAKVPKIDARMACFIADDLQRRHLPIDGLLKQVGLKKADLGNPENRLPQAPVLQLIERAADLTGDASYGLRLGASRGPRDRGLLGFVALNSPTLMDAMTNMQRFYKIAREGGEFEIDSKGAQVALRFRVADPALRGLRHNSEFLAATIVRGCRDLTCRSIFPVRAEFIHDQPSGIVDYANILGCPVKFGSEWDAVIYAEETTCLPVKGADAKLLEILQATCLKLLGPTPESRDVIREVRRLIIERLPRGAANIDSIAEELKMSGKTLERRLAYRGQSFSNLLDGTRLSTARHYLEETEMRLTQVAQLAGYTEPAALVRAFKRWTGETPMKFRDRQRSSMSN